VKLLKLVANLGYGSRKQVAAIAHGEVRIDGEPLDPAQGIALMLHKPVGYTCSTRDPGRVVYDLLPPRFRLRNPIISPVGRLDRDTSGLLLLTDDGALLHRIVSPRSGLTKVYEATLANDLRGDEAGLFASGSLMLESEKTPLLPVAMEILGPRAVRLTLTEGRYHQVRRMFAAVGNHVEALHRSRIGGLTLGDLYSGAWRVLGAARVADLFTNYNDS